VFTVYQRHSYDLSFDGPRSAIHHNTVIIIMIIIIILAEIKVILSQKCCRVPAQTAMSHITCLQSQQQLQLATIMFGHHCKMPETAEFLSVT